MNRLVTGIFLLALLLAVISSNSLGQDQELKAGKAIYEKKCAQCHGPQGKGDGPASPFQDPKPRDFTTGMYKIRSTPSGQLPTDADLLRVISQGMPGTGMPGFGKLTERERIQLVRFIKTLSERFASEPAGKPTPIAKEISPSAASLAKGKQIYQDMECFKCHGQEGRADGPSAPELEDDWGNRIRSANLAKPWLYRGGSSSRDIFIRFNTGMAGTPMPSYADSISPEESWHLTNYVKSLGIDNPNYGTLLLAKKVSGSMPKDLNDPLWMKAQGVNFPLVGQVIVKPLLFAPAIGMITIKAVYNDKNIAFLVSWDDPNQSMPDPSKKIYADAAALQFPAKIPEGTERPYFLMGDENSPVYLLKWSSDSPGISELNASGLGKEKAQPKESQSATSTVLYHQGQYRSMITRPLTTEDKANDIQFQPGRFIPISFIAWEGSNGEKESQMSLSSWYYLLLEEPASRKPYLYPPIAVLVAIGLELFITRKVRQKSEKGG